MVNLSVVYPAGILIMVFLLLGYPFLLTYLIVTPYRYQCKLAGRVWCCRMPRPGWSRLRGCGDGHPVVEAASLVADIAVDFRLADAAFRVLRGGLAVGLRFNNFEVLLAAGQEVEVVDVFADGAFLVLAEGEESLAEDSGVVEVCGLEGGGGVSHDVLLDVVVCCSCLQFKLSMISLHVQVGVLGGSKNTVTPATTHPRG